LSTQGLQGATLQSVNHGITIAALFAIVAVIAARWGTSDLGALGGLATKAPILAAIFLVATLSSLGLPGLNGFSGEFLILVGTFQANVADAVVGTIGVVLAAAYMMRLFQGSVHGPLGSAVAAGPAAAPAGTAASWFSELSLAQYVAILPLLVLMVWIGVAPGGWLNPTMQFAHSVVTIVGGRP
jgi:NADH-quinone oxidoreductase subunit M